MIAEAQAHRPWHYDVLIGDYRAAFGSDKVILLPYELLRQDPARFAGEIERRLGLDPGPILEDRANRALSPVEPPGIPACRGRRGEFPSSAAKRRAGWFALRFATGSGPRSPRCSACIPSRW